MRGWGLPRTEEDGSTVTGRLGKQTVVAVHLTEGAVMDKGQRVPVDGELAIERRQVLWVQRPD